jgi:hypothetical protein
VGATLELGAAAFPGAFDASRDSAWRKVAGTQLARSHTMSGQLLLRSPIRRNSSAPVCKAFSNDEAGRRMVAFPDECAQRTGARRTRDIFIKLPQE